MTAEIQYWDFRAADLKQKEQAGKTNAHLNSQMAARRADDLAARLSKRMEELANERKVAPMPPVITGGALVVPAGLIHYLMGDRLESTVNAESRRAVELAAMNAVMEIERSLGYHPVDVSANNVGYDIESFVPDEMQKGGNSLRFIEVKGRAKGADTVTVTKNEILTARNKPEDFILAIVEVDGDHTHAVYLKEMFHSDPDFAANCVTYDIKDLIQKATVIYQK